MRWGRPMGKRKHSMLEQMKATQNASHREVGKTGRHGYNSSLMRVYFLPGLFHTKPLQAVTDLVLEMIQWRGNVVGRLSLSLGRLRQFIKSYLSVIRKCFLLGPSLDRFAHSPFKKSWNSQVQSLVAMIQTHCIGNIHLALPPHHPGDPGGQEEAIQT